MLPLTYTFSRPVSSGWKPTPTAMSGATWPHTVTVPSVGAVTPASSRRSVDLPDPLRPMTPMHSPRSTRRFASRSAHSAERRDRDRKRNAWPTSVGVSSYFT